VLILKENVYREQFSIPIEFEKTTKFNFSDERFMPVKIWIAHTGENRNNSIFTKEALEYMAESLSNVPILGFLQHNEDEESDFAGHEEKISIKDGKIDIEYLGRAYGLIPESNNARFEYRYGSDGKEREYLVCDGIIWNKFKEIPKIFDRDDGFKSQSMELFPASIEGKFNEFGLFVYEKAKVEGACLLGEGVNPAMVSSTIEKFSINKSSDNGLKEMITEFNRLFSEIGKEGGEELAELGTEVVEVEEETTTEDVVEDIDATEQEEQEEKNAVEEAETEEKINNDEEEEKEDKFSEKTMIRTFEISHDDIRQGIYNQLDNHEAFAGSWNYIVDVFDNYAVVESGDKFYKVNYVKHENTVSLGDHEELFPMFLNKARSFSSFQTPLGFSG